jgi:hypothetical protein
VSSFPRRLLLAFAAGLMVAGVPTGAQFRPNTRESRQFRPSTTYVTITVPASAYNRATGVAVITVPRAVVGQLFAARPWVLTARAESASAPNRVGGASKPSTDLAIRAAGEPGFHPLTTSAVPLLTGARTDSWINVALDLQLTARLTDISGSYNFRLYFDFN